jgi:hypothetical protein
VSPFQKPTFITMSVEDLDKKFSLWCEWPKLSNSY